MKNNQLKWSKTELKIYILLLCANADSVQTDEEINLIKTKIDSKKFEKIFKEFSSDTEDESLEKIQDNIGSQEYSNKEIYQLRKDMHEIFYTDKKFKMMERNLDRILENMIY